MKRCLALALLFGTFAFGAGGCSPFANGRTFKVEGASMEPVFCNGQVVPLHQVGDVARFDIVVFQFPLDPSRDFIKRVIGLPGDTVEVRDATVFVNGSALRESYVKDPPNYSYAPRTVPADMYWVLGDNRRNSFDSHAWGTSCSPKQLCDFVPKENLLGRVPADTKGCKSSAGS